MTMMKTILNVFALVSLVCGDCPQMNDIPIMRYSDDGLEWAHDYGHVDEPTFTCARWWEEAGGHYDIDSCNGEAATPPDHFKYPGGWYMGSIFVKAGCTLYMFRESNYEGDSKLVRGPAQILNNDWGSNSYPELGPFVGSAQCQCIQEPVNCVPDDDYEVILVCDNLNGETSVKCTYSHTVGTEFSNEISEGMSIDVSVGEEMEMQLWGMFSAGSHWETSTGYDWNHVSSETKSEQTTITVEAEAPAGKKLIMEQAVGHCGGSEARTEMFRTSHQDSKGIITYEKTELIKRNQ